MINGGIAKKNNITIYNLFKDTSINIYADKTRITQVLINLLNNAVKYNKPDGEVTINAEKLSNQMIKISISDTGAGIKEEGLELIFEPFERYEYSHSTIEGSGVGLTVSKKLIEVMKGKIGVESRYGEGSTFWIVIPQA